MTCKNKEKKDSIQINIKLWFVIVTPIGENRLLLYTVNSLISVLLYKILCLSLSIFLVKMNSLMRINKLSDSISIDLSIQKSTTQFQLKANNHFRLCFSLFHISSAYIINNLTNRILLVKNTM